MKIKLNGINMREIDISNVKIGRKSNKIETKSSLDHVIHSNCLEISEVVFNIEAPLYVNGLQHLQL